VLEDLLAALSAEPHPELVAIQRPSPEQVTAAAAKFGWLPDRDAPWLRPALAGQEERVVVP
jgi:predicted dehydrogenase